MNYHCASVLSCKRQQEINGSSNFMRHFKTNSLKKCCHLYSKSLTAHYGCVNAVEFSNGTKELLATGGDDKRVLLWHLGESFSKTDYKPTSMIAKHFSNIFCISFDAQNSKLFSSGNDEQLLVHDIASQQVVTVYLRDDAVYSLSTHPNDVNIFATASEDGKIKMTDMRVQSSAETVCLANYISAFHGVAFNPVAPMYIATANSKEGAALWDIRKPKSVVLRYGNPFARESAMSVQFNETGTNLVVLRRRKTPRLYRTHSEVPVVDCFADEYLNSCTMKSGCFAGVNDEYIVSGSDDFKVYLWKIPPAAQTENRINLYSPKIILYGHRSIVNQVRYNKEVQVLASSGVEKLIKLWSPFRYPNFTGRTDEPISTETRQRYSRHEYVDLVLRSGMSLNHDYESENTAEDPRMMAFFDSLIKHDRQQSSESSSDDDDSTDARMRLIATIMAHSRPDGMEDQVSSDWLSSSDDSESNPTTPTVVLSQMFRGNHSVGLGDGHTRLRRLRASLRADIESTADDSVSATVDADNAPQTSTSDLGDQVKSNGELQESNGVTSPSSSTLCSSTITCKRVLNKSNPSVSNNTNIAMLKSNFLKRRRASSSDQSSSENEYFVRSEMRKRNAHRHRKVKKRWPIGVERKDLKATIEKQVETSSNSHNEHFSNNVTLKNGSSDRYQGSPEEAGSSMSAYDRSRIKLHQSVEATELKLAEIADNLATAIEVDETDLTQAPGKTESDIFSNKHKPDT